MKIIFNLKITYLISYFLLKSNNYQNITKTHSKLNICIPTSYMSSTMHSIRSQLLPNSNFTFLTLWEKSSKFFAHHQDSDLSTKLNSTHQYESRGMLGFQNRAADIKLLKFYANRDNSIYFKKIWFSMEARFPILRPPLDSSHRKEFDSGLES